MYGNDYFPTVTDVHLKMWRYGDEGWTWHMTATSRYDGTLVEWRARTNGRGDGMWSVREYEDKQVLGTCQFSLPFNRGAAYSRLRRYIDKQYFI